MVTRRIGFQQFFQTSPLVQRFLLPNARPTGQQLGVGSYGSVEEVEISGLVCAGKRLHESLIETGNFGRETIVSKYGDECQLMSDLRHPNIVQFLGLCFLPASPLPLLVMERLSTSLDDLLESSPNIPLAMKRSILADVSRGLVYLHTHNPPVIHRDLSARNVLLNSAMVAKISDLGNSRIVDLRPGQLARTLSRHPGTMVYMAPEALQGTSRYGTKLDMFSFGHLGLFTVIQIFPGDLLPSTYFDPENPERIIGISEAERRRVYFEQLQSQLGAGHPLERLILGCLQNSPSLRPSAEEALRQLEDMRALLHDPYEAMNKLEMVRTLQEKDREIQQLQIQGQQPMPLADDQSRQKMEDLQQQIRQLQLAEETLRTDLQTRENELQQTRADNRRLTNELRAREVLEEKREGEAHEREAEISRLLRETRSLQSQLHRLQKSEQPTQTGVFASLQRWLQGSTPKPLKLPLQLMWEQCRNMPFGMRLLCSVVLKGKVYVGGGEASADGDEEYTVMVYDLQSGRWDRLPQYGAKWFRMAVVNDQLVLVGGKDRRTGMRINQLSVWDERSRQWKPEVLPPMTTPRSNPYVCTYNEWLVVAGGYGEDGRVNTVELLDTTTGLWYTAAPLSQKCSQTTSAVVEDTWYLLVNGQATKVFSVSLPDLIFQATSPPRSRSKRPNNPWQALLHAPLKQSAALALRGSLLTIGGTDDNNADQSAIHLYQPGTRQWVRVGHLPSARSCCSCVSLPNGEFLVLGGQGLVDRVDMGTVLN